MSSVSHQDDSLISVELILDGPLVVDAGFPELDAIAYGKEVTMNMEDMENSQIQQLIDERDRLSAKCEEISRAIEARS